MAEHQERTVSVRDGKLQIKVMEGGSGDPLVYLHGAGGLPGWTPYLDRLAREFRVYAPYHPGVGASTGLEHLDDLWDLVLFYEELADALGLGQFSLVGHSYGGMLAAELAAQCPSRVRRLALIASIGLWLDHTPLPDIFVMSPEDLTRAAYYDPDSEAAKAAFAQPDDPQARMEATLDRTKTLASVGKFTWPIPERGLKKRIHRITAPTLLLWGADDGLVPPAYGEEFSRLIPGSRLTVIDRCGHSPLVESPDEAFPAISEFLRG